MTENSILQRQANPLDVVEIFCGVRTSMIEPKLNPCPFCGGIECMMCRACSVAMLPEKCDVLPLLAERWNNRVNTSESKEKDRLALELYLRSSGF